MIFNWASEDEIFEAIDNARAKEAKDIWDEIGSHIESDRLPGGDVERNGLILAANIILERRTKRKDGNLKLNDQKDRQMTKRYEVTITETMVETVVLPAGWVHGGVPEKDHPDSEYGYCSEKETRQTVTREIYKQNVESLDLRAVIFAVNEGEPMVYMPPSVGPPEPDSSAQRPKRWVE